MGMNPRRVHQTAAAMVHSQWPKEGYGGLEGREAAAKGETGEWPDSEMLASCCLVDAYLEVIWVTNAERLSGRHASAMFFASKTFAPKCTIDGRFADEWLQEHWNNAFGYLAERIGRAGGLLDETVIGWDSMNEPSPGFIGVESIDTMPEDQEFRKGPSPTPIQALRLGNGQPVEGIEYNDFTSTGLKKKGTVQITPPDGLSVWLTRQEAEEAQAKFGYKWGREWDFWNADGSGGCPWAGHGVWDPQTGKSLNAGYFLKGDGGRVDFIEDFWRRECGQCSDDRADVPPAWYEKYIGRIRQGHKLAISFINPPIFKQPPDLSEDVKRGRMALSCHFYDGLTMLGKRRHVFNANSVKLQRGMINLFQALKFGRQNIRDTMHEQLAELKSDSKKPSGIAAEEGGGVEYPTIIGEIGVPFDMKANDSLFGLAKGKSSSRDYKEPAKAMDEVLSGCDGENALSYTIWCYEPLNDHKNGDGWQGEDLSLFSYDDIEGDEDLLANDPPDLKTLITLGARGIDAWCRPYPAEVCGKIHHFTFDMSTSEFELQITRVSFADSKLWQAETRNLGVPEADVTGGPVTALIYVPFVHYLHSGVQETTGQQRLIGKPGEGLNEWIKGKGPAVVDIEIQELSEGNIEVVGQWMKWTYAAPKARSGDLHLKFRKWKI